MAEPRTLTPMFDSASPSSDTRLRSDAFCTDEEEEGEDTRKAHRVSMAAAKRQRMLNGIAATTTTTKQTSTPLSAIKYVSYIAEEGPQGSCKRAKISLGKETIHQFVNSFCMVLYEALDGEYARILDRWNTPRSVDQADMDNAVDRFSEVIRVTFNCYAVVLPSYEPDVFDRVRVFSREFRMIMEQVVAMTAGEDLVSTGLHTDVLGALFTKLKSMIRLELLCAM